MNYTSAGEIQQFVQDHSVTQRIKLRYCLYALLVGSACFAFWIWSVATDLHAAPRVVLVAKKNLSVGDKIDNPEECFELAPAFRGENGAPIAESVIRKYLAGKVTIAPNVALTSYSQVRGQHIRRNIRQSEFVTPDDILGWGAHVSPPLPEGTVYVSLRINATKREARILPHQEADIYCRSPRGCRLLVEQARVVAVDQTHPRRDNENDTLVTLGMSAQDVLKLELAKTMGIIVLKIGDQEIGTPHVTERDDCLAEFALPSPFPQRSACYGLRVNATKAEARAKLPLHGTVDIYCTSQRGPRPCVQQALVLAINRRLRVKDGRNEEDTIVAVAMRVSDVAELELAMTLGPITVRIADLDIGTPYGPCSGQGVSERTP